MFLEGEEYRRRDIHALYGGQEQGGISTPSKYPFILLFTGDTGSEYGYKDGWVNDELFHYSGEGQYGDMQFIRGNAAIRDHLKNGKDLHLFKYVRRGYVQHMGRMLYAGHHFAQTKDLTGNIRNTIIFELTKAK